MQFLRHWFARLGLPCVSLIPADRQCRIPKRRRITTYCQLELEVLEKRALPSVVGTGTGLTGWYYGDQTFTSLKLMRVDPTVNFNWGTAAPTSALPADHFSVRWTGIIQAPDTGVYTFTTHSDDGVRLIVNEQPVVDNMTNHSLTANSGTVSLAAGQKYLIEMDYFDNTGTAVAQLSWKRPNGVSEIVPTAQLYPRDTVAPTAALTAKPITVPSTAPYTFQVVYKDDVSIYGWSLHTGNVVVTGPKNFTQTASLVKVDQVGDGPQRIATYQITAPGGSWDTADNGAYTVNLVANQIRDVAANFIPAHALGTFSVTLAGADWFDDHFTDNNFTNLVRSLDADHSLSRTDVIAIIREVETGGVSAAELGDLRTLVANAGFLGMPGYVTELANKVVNGDPANGRYQGQTLGNLYAGSSGTQLEHLVDKWFLGMDHPALESGLHYALAAGTLFGSGPAYTDIVQGSLNDCYFLAGLGETVVHAPASIRSMFIDNGDGTVTVRFLDYGLVDYVTVDRYLPAASDGTYAYANVGTALSNTGTKLWVALAEKAYAQLAEEGWTRGPGLANAYSSINIGWDGDVVGQITGKTETFQVIANTSTTFTALVNDVQSGRWVGLASKSVTAPGIVNDHAYVVLGYNTITHLFTLYNPWGMTLQLSWSQIAGNFSGWSRNVN
ncbi:hypothetical protein AYO44_08975 [Planctomycetaceae bacterium SCGC AG-212-F19]|nr:hypothetical protein AYO44_08975 [Planctomycetaceae bacterium SCGC AG-212-F19]